MKNLNKILKVVTLVVAFFLVTNAKVSAQDVVIPDANFKAYLVGRADINTNSDGEIQANEAQAFTGTIDVNGLGITDLTGIEAFTALTELDCNHNSLMTIDVSTNTALVHLDVTYNQLTTIDVTNNAALVYFICQFNQITAINVSANTALTGLSVYNNPISTLDVSALTNLQHLGCNNMNLTTLDVSANHALIDLYCNYNQLASLNIQNGNNTNMQNLQADHNPLLTCIQVDDVSWAIANWTVSNFNIDASESFSLNCSCIWTPPTPPVITANGPPIFCAGGNVVLGVSSYPFYAWSDGSSDYFITVTTSGTYTITVTDANGCTGTASQDVSVHSNTLNLYTDNTSGVCNEQVVFVEENSGQFTSWLWSNGGTNNFVFDDITTTTTYSVTATDNIGCTGTGSVEVVVLGGPVPTITSFYPTDLCGPGTAFIDAGSYSSYSWSNGGFAETVHENVSTSTTYTVTVTDASGCTGSASIDINVHDLPIPTITANQTTFCGGSLSNFLSLVETSGPYPVYIWNHNNTGENDIHTFITQSTNYSVTVMDAHGCSGVASIDITVNPNPSPTIFSYYPTSFCGSGTIYLDASGWSSFSWSNGGTDQTVHENISTSTTYIVTVTDGNGCTGTASQDITVNPSPANQDFYTQYCDGATPTLSLSDSYASYLWGTGETTASIVVDVTSDITYCVTVTNDFGCTGVSCIHITDNALPTPVMYSQLSSTFCVGDYDILYADQFNFYSTYLWSDGTTDPSIYVYTSGTYSITVNDVNGCSGTTSIAITANPVPTPTITSNLPTTTCDGNTLSSMTLDAGSGYTAYLWYNWDNSTNETLSPNNTGTFSYAIQVTDGNGCTGTGTIDITVVAPYTVTITANGPTTQTLCTGVDLDLTLDAGSGYTSYNWFNYDASTNQTLHTNYDNNFTYSVQVTDANGCIGYGSLDVFVTVTDPFVVNITANGPTTQTLCTGVDLDLILDAGAGYSIYNWYNWDASTNQTLHTSYNNNFTYSVQVIDANGCIGYGSLDVFVTVSDPFVVTVTANGPTTFCQGGSVTLDAGSGYSTYAWYNYDNSTDETLFTDYSSSYPYQVRVTDINGCIGLGELDLTVNTTPYPFISPNGNTTFCQGSSVDLSVFDYNSNAPYLYYWSNGETDATITASITGTYTVTISNQYGCTATTSVDILVSIPNPQMYSVYSTTFCEGNNDQLWADYNTSYYGYNWSDASTNWYLNVFHSGSYSVTVTDAYGCTGVTSIVITENQNPTPSITPVNPTFCGQGVLDAGVGYSSYYWYSSGETTQTVSTNGSGTYYVSVTDVNGCSASTSTDVTVNSFSDPTIVGSSTFCTGGSTILNAGFYYGYDNYLWSSGETTASITVNTPGTYTVTVSNNNGCSGTTSLDVTLGSALTPQLFISPSSTICFGGTIFIDAGYYDNWAYASYVWSDASTQYYLYATTTGDYSVTVTDNSGCTGVATANIIVNSNPIVPTITADGPTTFCNGGSVTLDAGVGYASYYWYYSSATSQTETVTGDGTYIVVVSNADGCTSTASIVVTVTPDFNVTITPSGSTTICQGASITLDAGAGYTSYYWYNYDLSTNQTLTTNYAYSFNYGVEVTDANGCHGYGTLNVTVEQPLNITITSSGSTTICEGYSGLTLDAGVGYATYNWSYPSNSTNEIITPLSTNSYTYSVQVTDNNGCIGNGSIDVHITPAFDVTITANGSTSLCDGNNVTLDAGSYSTYYWYWDSSTDEMFTTNYNSSYTYNVSVTDANGCIGNGNILVTVNPNPSVTITPSGPTTFNQGGHVVLDAGTYATYSWSNNSTDESIDVNTSGTYEVTVVDANGCIGISSIDVTVNQTGCSITPIGSTTFCQGGSVLLDAGTGISYMWSDGTTDQINTVTLGGNYSVTITDITSATCVATQTVTVNSNPTPSISPNQNTFFCDGGSVGLDAGSYSMYNWSNGNTDENIIATTNGNTCVTVTDANGCTGSACITITVYQNPSVSITPNGNTTFCDGGTIDLDAGVWSNYSWSNGNPNEIYTATTSGDYCVTIIDGNGCMGSACIQVTVNQNPSPFLTWNGYAAFCDGGSVTLDAGSWNSYSWNNGGNTEFTTISTSFTAIVTISDANGCTGTASQDVTVFPNPTPTISVNGNTTFCAGGSVMLDAGSFQSYSWSNNSTDETITATATGTYTVTVTDGFNCHGTASQVVTVNNNPNPTITPNGPTTFCTGGSVTLNLGSFASYNWSNGATTQSITTSQSGNFIVTVTDANGCVGMTSQSVTVNSNPNPTITPNGNTSFCSGGSVLLNAGLFNAYNWSNGTTTQTATVSTSGIVTVTVTTSHGCTGTASITIFVSAGPSPTITANGPTTFCDGGSVGLNAGQFASYMWNTGSTNASITAFGSQPYCVTVTDGIGCTGTNCIFITVNALPSASITGNSTICNGGSATLSAATAAFYLWSTGATTQSITSTTSGSYCVTVSNNFGCTASACHSLTVFSALQPTITPNGSTSFCQTSSVTLDAGAGYSSYSWSNGSTNQSVTVNTSSTFTVTVSNAAGCTGTASQIVVVTPLITGLTIVGPTTSCSGSGSLTTGTTYQAYLWSNGATTQSINVTATAVYYVTVSNGGSCTAVAHQAVTILTIPMPNILANGLANLCGGGSATLTVGAVFASYNWSTGETTQGITINGNGTYTVTVVSANGCTGTQSLVVTSGCNVPTFGTTPTTNIASTGAMANWIQPACRYNYTIQISLHNANIWVPHTIAANTHYMFSGLLHNTAYDWQIQTNCNASGSVNSGFSAIQTFTTAPRLELGESDNTIASFNAYPNPASDQVTVTFSSSNEENYSLRLMDVTGRTVLSNTNTSVVGENQYQLNLSSIARGIYMVVLQKGDATLQTKIVVQ